MRSSVLVPRAVDQECVGRKLRGKTILQRARSNSRTFSRSASVVFRSTELTFVITACGTQSSTTSGRLTSRAARRLWAVA